MLVCSVGLVTVNLVAVAVTVPVVVLAVTAVDATIVCAICCLLTVFILRLVTPCGLVVAEKRCLTPPYTCRLPYTRRAYLKAINRA